MKFWRRYSLEIVVFVCGAVVMTFQLLGSRVLGPYVGTSTYAWTSLIGVTLAGLSAGYYVGGYWADKKSDTKSLAWIIIYASLAITLTAFLKDSIASVTIVSGGSLELKSVIISLFLFAPASFLLGMVSPYAVKLRMIDVTKAGKNCRKSLRYLHCRQYCGNIFSRILYYSKFWYHQLPHCYIGSTFLARITTPYW